MHALASPLSHHYSLPSHAPPSRTLSQLPKILNLGKIKFDKILLNDEGAPETRDVKELRSTTKRAPTEAVKAKVAAARKAVVKGRWWELWKEKKHIECKVQFKKQVDGVWTSMESEDAHEWVLEKFLPKELVSAAATSKPPKKSSVTPAGPNQIM